MNFEFNSKAFDERVEQEVRQCKSNIKTSWETGIPVVHLSVDSYMYQRVRDELLRSIPDLGLGRLNAKALSLPGKDGKTRFKVIHTKTYNNGNS